jgi:putative transposase
LESFNGKFRDACLDPHWSASLAQASASIQNWKEEYHHEGPQSALQHLAPSVFAHTLAT